MAVEYKWLIYIFLFELIPIKSSKEPFSLTRLTGFLLYHQESLKCYYNIFDEQITTGLKYGSDSLFEMHCNDDGNS